MFWRTDGETMIDAVLLPQTVFVILLLVTLIASTDIGD